ncbi:MAG TPA: LuxR C-terminal-related transcriptional regulator, partial [Albitalea sp.]
PEAARAAAARGAHRQAARHWGHALEHAAGGAESAALLDAYAVEVHMSVDVEEAIAARREAARLWCEAGRPGNAAVSLARQSVLFMYSSRIAEGERAVREARALVASDSSSPAAYIVQSCAAWLSMLKRDCDEAIALALPVLAEAERTSDAAEAAASLKTIGGALLYAGRVDEGIAHLERGLAVAMAANEDRLAGQVLANLGSGCIGALRLDQAEAFLRQGIEYCGERDLDAPRLFQTGWLAMLELMRGRWDASGRAANEVIHDGRATVIGRIAALVALARLKARRGDPGGEALLDEADRLGADTDIHCRIARAEAAWLGGRPQDAAREASALLPLGAKKHRAGAAAELLLWAGPDRVEIEMPPLWAASPFALEAAGRWQEAAAAWRALGCPYETARALARGDEAAQREALAIFESLGASPMVERVRRSLRAAGVRSLPRGPLPSTRTHAAGLTSKELAVLELLASGLRNKEIALRLSRSVRTIDHHLQAIFAKLSVSTRAEAVSAAYCLGVMRTEGSPLPQSAGRSVD